MSYESDLARGLNRLNPASTDNRAWAERELAALMEEFNMSREDALAVCKQYAPTIYGWVTSG